MSLGLKKGVFVVLSKEAREIREREINSLKAKLEEDELFCFNTKQNFKEKERVHVVIDKKVRDKLNDFINENQEVLKDEYGIKSRNILLSRLIEYEVENIDKIFNKLKKKTEV